MFSNKMIDYTLSYLINRNLRVHFDLTDVHALTGTLTISSDVKQEYVFFFLPEFSHIVIRGCCWVSALQSVWTEVLSWRNKERLTTITRIVRIFFLLYYFETKMNSAIKCMFLLACIHLCASHSKWNPFSYSSFLFFILIFTVLYLPVSG